MIHESNFVKYHSRHMGHQDQDGEKVGEMSLFFKSQRLLRTEKSKNAYTFKSYYLILASRVLKI